MARKIKFALEMANGVKVRSNLEELKENFDLEKTVGHFLSGKLVEWLEDRYYEDEAEAINAIDKDAPDLRQRICEALGVEYADDTELDVEALERLNEKKAILRQKTSDGAIIANAAQTALSQEDLADLLDIDEPVMYLCGESFNVPIRVGGKKYIGILGTPKISIKANSQADLDAKGIMFENVILPWGNAAQAQDNAVGTQTTSVSVADEVVPLEELQDLYKSSFSERIRRYTFLEDEIWEVVKASSDGDPIEGEALSEAQKKVALRLLCKNQYSANDVAHVCITKDFTSGWAFTKDAFCIYQKGVVESVVIPYKDIAVIETLDSVRLLAIATVNEATYRFSRDGAFGYGLRNYIANYLDVVKNLFAE